jgi:CHAT domain-containing protein
MIRTEYKNAQTDKADTAYLALIVSNESIRPLLIKNGKALETTYLQAYQKLMKVSKNPIVFEDTLFYRAFWQPIAQQLGSEVKTVYFSPDGVYHQINLNTLQDPVSKRFVVEENYQIQLLTSLQDLFAEKKANENKTALLVGRPQYSMSKEEYQAAVSNVRGGEELISEAQTANKAVSEVKWGDLPETETEVASVSKLLKERKWAAEVFTGRSALEEQIKKGKNPTILHIATHGYFIPTNSKNQINGMLNSGLVLAGVNTSDKDDKSEDGILTAYEAADLSLDDTDLVVLSACETGLGEVASGEGVYGLQRGFKVAGAKSLIMSLWRVDDTVTQELMKTFYEQWLSGKNKREAFKIAQLQIKNKYKYPYFWGAFVMVGE